MNALVLERGQVHQSLQLVLGQDDADVAYNAGPICDHVLPAGQDEITPRRGQVVREGVNLQVMLMAELADLVADDLALHGQTAWRVYRHR